jgi:chemotaxis protein CheX
MKVEYINPFLLAVQNVFNTMIDLPYTIGKPTIKKSDLTEYDVSGIIGISGEVIGCVVVSFPTLIALKVGSCLLGEELKEVDSDCTDAIGEVANMIAGDAKKRFPKTNTTISVPSVVIGSHKVAYPSGIPIISIPCETDAAQFAIEVALKEA